MRLVDLPLLLLALRQLLRLPLVELLRASGSSKSINKRT
jgi:hypothetical protein